MLHFYSWMRSDSPHHHYMCLVTVHSRNFTVWRHKSIPCGVSRGAEIRSLGKVSRGESHPHSWTLPMKGFSNNLLQVSSGEKFWRKGFTQLWHFNTPSDSVTSTLSLHGGKMQSCWSVWPLFGCTGIKASGRPRVISWPLFRWPTRVTTLSSWKVYGQLSPIEFLPQAVRFMLCSISVPHLQLLPLSNVSGFNWWKLLKNKRATKTTHFLEIAFC